jgi:hypothetical protein
MVLEAGIIFHSVSKYIQNHILPLSATANGIQSSA